MTTIEKAIAALSRLGCDPRPCGEGWTARCPGPTHPPDDPQRALWVTVAPDGRIVLDCHGNHDAEESHAPAGGVS